MNSEEEISDWYSRFYHFFFLTTTGRLSLLALTLTSLLFFTTCTMFSMPGESFQDDPPPLTSRQKTLKKRLKKHVSTLAGDIGQRDVYHIEQLNRARTYIQDQFSEMGYQPREQTYKAQGKTVANVVVEQRGKERPEEIVVIGAHYDTASNPGADDNASGVAGLLELARRFRDAHTDRTLRFVAFVNEEPPFFHTEKMGSRVYARRAKQRDEDIVEMMSLEMLGYFSSEPGSQDYPFPVSWFYPSTGNFIAFVGNYSNGDHVRNAIAVFRKHAKVPSEGGAPPGWISGVGWSDHWSFWQEGYPGIMVTDTAVFRNPNYHRPSDLPETLNDEKMTRVFHGLEPVIREMVNVDSE